MRIPLAIIAVAFFASFVSPLASQQAEISDDLFAPDAPRTTEPFGTDASPFPTEPPAAAGGRIASAGNQILIENCHIEPVAEPVVAASEAGRLMMGPQLGAELKKDELVGKTDDTMALHQQRVAFFQYQAEKTKLDSDIEMRYAEKQADVKEAGYRDAADANQKVKNAVSPNMLRERLFGWQAAKLGIEKSEHDMAITKAGAEVKLAEYEAAETMVKRHEIKSPVTGIVQEVFKHEGEWVTPGDPIARLTQLDRVRVFGQMKLSECGCAPGKLKGAAVTIEIPVAYDANGKPTEYKSVRSTIMHVGGTVSEADDFKVWAEIANTPGLDFWPGTPKVIMKLQLP